MPLVRQILVAVKDPEAKSLPAVTKAAQLARAWNARLELFHAIDVPIPAALFGVPGGSPQEIESAWRNRVTRQLEEIAATLRRRGLRVSTAAEWDHPVYEAIIRRAVQIRAGLIVAERHSGRYVAPWLLHVTDWELLRLSPVPVLIVKDARPYRRPTVLAAVDPIRAGGKPDRLDEAILRLGSAVADALHGRLHAVHARPPLPLGIPPSDLLPPETLMQAESLAAQQAEAAFDRLATRFDLPPARRHLVDRAPAEAIGDVARRIGCAIVVMGAVSRSGLERTFFGNTAERVLPRLACDLLIVKPPRFECRIPTEPRGARLPVGAPLP